MPLRQPLPQARRQQELLLAIAPDEILRYHPIVLTRRTPPTLCDTLRERRHRCHRPHVWGSAYAGRAVSRIFLRHGGTYVAMTEQAYDAESILQKLIAGHPEMLAGDASDQGRLLLVRREAGVSDAEEGGARWSLDHLYLDSEGVPTLVEVKRSSDTRGRREVVAQMLDYAANAKTSFNVEQLEAWLAENAAREDTSVQDVLREAFGVDDPERFWDSVRTNIAAERLRLIFVSDAIAPELRRIIEFLNGQMTRTEVLAIEVKQYVDEHGDHQTIVPRVIGDTETAKQTKSRPRRRGRIDRTQLLTSIRDISADAAIGAEALLDWAEHHPHLEVRWTRAADIALPDTYALMRISESAKVSLELKTVWTVDPTWDDDDRLQDLRRRLETIEGVHFPPGHRSWPRTPLAPLADPDKRRRFLEIIDEVVAGLALIADEPTADR